MLQTKINIHRLLLVLSGAVVLVGMFLLFSDGLQAEEPASATEGVAQPSAVDISDLESKIREKRQSIDELERQQRIYEETITKKRQEALSLRNQIGLLDNQIEKAALDIDKLELQIESLGLEVAELELEIEAKDFEIRQQKERLSELLRVLHRYSRQTILEISLLNETFSEFYNQLKYLETVEEEAKRSLDTIEGLRQDLENERNLREEKKRSSEEKQQQLEIERKGLESQQTYREDLLQDTKQSEATYEKLLHQAKQEQLNANADIQSLEYQIRQRLSQDQQLPQGPTAFVWPVPSRTITAYFHDPSYIFRRYFEHPAIDVATPQGMSIRAAASGFVARAKNAGLGYSYIMIIHGDNLSTVYGHVSQISVVENDFVVQGQVIGAAGGTPGTPGAGRLTTGPHLHFEIRLSGIPIDPLGYLP